MLLGRWASALHTNQLLQQLPGNIYCSKAGTFLGNIGNPAYISLL